MVSFRCQIKKMPLNARTSSPRKIIYIGQIFLVILPLIWSAPIDQSDPWDDADNTQNLTPVDMNDDGNGKHMSVYKMATILSSEEKQLLNELERLLSQQNNAGKGSQDGLDIDLDQKSRVVTPYFMRSILPSSTKRGISTPYFMKRGVAIPYFMKRGVTIPYFMKRGEDGRVVAPYFMKRTVGMPYFMKRGKFVLPEESNMSNYLSQIDTGDEERPEVGELTTKPVADDLTAKRIFGRMNALDLENYLALAGADDKYSRQLWSNEQKMRLEGK
ncbi:uncharacterized protein LOC120330927 [Styela clava]